MMDYFTVLGFENGKSEFLYCFETVTRQAITRYNYESINFQTVPKSMGFYEKESQSIITCGSQVDEKYKCHMHGPRTSVEFSEKLLPINSAVIELENEIWFLGSKVLSHRETPYHTFGLSMEQRNKEDLY